MSNILSKILFSIRKPKIIIVVGNGKKLAKEAVLQVIKPNFKIGINVLLFETDLEDSKELKEFEFFVKKSSLPVLIVTNLGEIPADKDSFVGDKKEAEKIQKLAEKIPARGYLILNFDDEIVREMAINRSFKKFTFGFQEGADFRASDIKINPVRESEESGDLKGADFSNGVNGGTNFKINYKGNVVPVWLEKSSGKEYIYSALTAACLGTIFNLNLVEISQALKNYQPFSLEEARPPQNLNIGKS